MEKVPFKTADAVKIILLLIGLQFINILMVGVGTLFIKPPAPVFFLLTFSIFYLLIFLAVFYFVAVKYNLSLVTLGLNSFNYISSFFLSIVAVFAFLVLTLGYQQILNFFGIKIPSQEQQLLQFFGKSSLSLIAIFLITVVIAPVVEEIFFRGFLYQAIKNNYGVNPAIWISATVFALFHFGVLVALPMFILIGAMLAYFFERYKSIYASIMLHAINNFVGFLGILYLVKK